MPIEKSPDELRSTLNWITEATSYGYMATQELTHALRELHASFGDNPNELVLDLERNLTFKLNKEGLENRYEDALAKEAGTYQESPPPATPHEIEMYLGTIGLQPKAIQLIRPVDSAESLVYVEISSPLLAPIKDSILRAMQRTMPPRVTLESLDNAPMTGFVERYPTHGLQLKAYGQEDWASETSTLEYLMKEQKASAVRASKVFKDAGGPTISFRVCLAKASDEPMERIVTGAILEPEVVDATKDDEMGTEGDIYSEEEIQQAMYWWMEHANSQSAYHHVEKGGKSLTSQDVVLLENWQTRIDQTIGDQLIKKGTWMSTERVLNDELWNDIMAGNITAWSIGAAALGTVERIHA